MGKTKSIPERFDNKLGYIEVSEEFYDKKNMFEIFRRFIPLKMNYDFYLAGRRFLLLGYSEDFRVIKEGQKYPAYRVELEMKRGKIINISFKETSSNYGMFLT